jgi:hypothetical protein
MSTGYAATLQSMPEPLRSQMLRGDFKAGLQDDPWQVIPSEWIKAAQGRWKKRDAKGPMDSIGVDVSRGGRDKTTIARRHGAWFDELIAHPGSASPDGPTVAGYVVAARRDRAVVHIDVIGVGSSPYDFLRQNQVQVVGVDNARESLALSREGGLRFVNQRAELWWRMRESLDPNQPQGQEPIALPPDPELRADLASAKWRYTPRGILVESKEDIIKRLGRSPDKGDAACLANLTTPKVDALPGRTPAMTISDYDVLGPSHSSSGGRVIDSDYDPLTRD